MKAACDLAAKRSIIKPVQWGPPALYAGGKWPRANYDWVADPLLRESLITTQDWVRAIRHARTDRRMSLRALAKATRTQLATLSELEVGARWPSLPVLLRVSQVLGVTVEIREPE